MDAAGGPGPSTIACTIAARNYLAQTRVLARSYREHHPTSPFVALMVDGDRSLAREDEPFEVLLPEDLPLDRRRFARMASLYDILELSTALKPWLLELLLERAEVALYLDPDIRFYAPVDEVAAAAARTGVALTPHILAPLPDDGADFGETNLLAAGIYNLGFIGVGRSAPDLLAFWQARLERECRNDPANQRFVDQRWIDLVPGFRPVEILRDPGLNVAYWNVHQRALGRHPDGWRVGTGPLRFFHFSGYDPDAPHLLSRHQGHRPRVLLSQHPALAALCEGYGAELRAAGYDEARRVGYGLAAMPNGVPMDRTLRRLFRDALEAAAEADDVPVPLDPDGCEAFLDLVTAAADPTAPDLSRYHLAVHDGRPDVRDAMPDPVGRDRERFVAWLATSGRTEGPIPLELRRARRSPSLRVGPPHGEGVNLAGYLRAELGVGEAARLLAAALDGGRVPRALIGYDRTVNRLGVEVDEDLLEDARYDVNVFCVNADQLAAFNHEIGHRLRDGRRTVGFWWWEVDRFPERYHGAFALVDEVWVGSRFVRDAVAAATDKPVRVVPLPVMERHAPPPPVPGDLHVPPGPTVFTFLFDFLSILERKNPFGLVEAYRDAVGPADGAVLLLKSINGHHHVGELERLRWATRDRSDIVVWDGFVRAVERDAVLARTDCYVSLHRSEGFGLTMAEAMSLGKPVIATAYSGNLDFMHEANSLLVPYRLVPVPPGHDPYPVDASWADPDLAVAGRHMRAVCDDPAGAAALGAAARDELARERSPEAAGAAVRDLVEAARRGGAATPAAAMPVGGVA